MRVCRSLSQRSRDIDVGFTEAFYNLAEKGGLKVDKSFVPDRPTNSKQEAAPSVAASAACLHVNDRFAPKAAARLSDMRAIFASGEKLRSGVALKRLQQEQRRQNPCFPCGSRDRNVFRRYLQRHQDLDRPAQYLGVRGRAGRFWGSAAVRH